MNEYEKRKLLLDAVLALVKERKTDLFDEVSVQEVVSLANFLLEQIEKYMEK
jgi:hypothetical protein